MGLLSFPDIPGMSSTSFPGLFPSSWGWSGPPPQRREKPWERGWDVIYPNLKSIFSLQQTQRTQQKFQFINRYREKSFFSNISKEEENPDLLHLRQNSQSNHHYHRTLPCPS